MGGVSKKMAKSLIYLQGRCLLEKFSMPAAAGKKALKNTMKFLQITTRKLNVV